MAKTIATKYLAILGFGSLCVLVGSIIGGAGAFRSVMADPSEDGPVTAAENTQIAGTTYNYRHYVAVMAYFPEVFDCDNLRDLYQLNTTDAELLSGSISTSEDIRAAVTDLCWRQSGRQAWMYALYFPVLLIFLILAFIAAFRKSGFQAAIAGVGLSAFMITYTALIIVQFQSQSNIPYIVQAFGDCDDFSSDATVLATFAPSSTGNLALKDGNRYNLIRGNTNHFDEVTTTTNGQTVVNADRSPSRLFGNTPRRAFLCEDDWEYDNRFLTSANLLYGGCALTAFGLLFVLVAFGYIAFPFLKVVPAAGANQAQKNAPLTRGVDDVVYEDEYTYTEDA